MQADADSGLLYDVVAIATTPKQTWRVVLLGQNNQIACEVTFDGPDAKRCAEEYAEMMALVRDEG